MARKRTRRGARWESRRCGCGTDRVYLTLALALGSAFLVLTPPFQVADERAHFRRAFAIAEGHVVPLKRGDSTGDEQPRSIDSTEQRYQRLFLRHEEKTSAAQIREDAQIRLDPEERSFAAFPNTATRM
jgi:hypothetical protein